MYGGLEESTEDNMDWLDTAASSSTGVAAIICSKSEVPASCLTSLKADSRDISLRITRAMNN